MKESFENLFAIVTLTAVIVGGSMYVYYGNKIDLYQQRLKEQIDLSHDLQHELDPLHQRFGHGGQQEEPKEEEHEHAHHEPEEVEHVHHQHDALDITDSDWRPSVSIAVHEDPKSGWNVEINTENFVFSPKNASTEHREGEGHAHIYVDGEKLSRVYGNWYYIGSMEPGERTVKVNLNANDHNVLTIDGEEVMAEAVVVVE